MRSGDPACLPRIISVRTCWALSPQANWGQEGIQARCDRPAASRKKAPPSGPEQRSWGQTKMPSEATDNSPTDAVNRSGRSIDTSDESRLPAEAILPRFTPGDQRSIQRTSMLRSGPSRFTSPSGSRWTPYRSTATPSACGLIAIAEVSPATGSSSVTVSTRASGADLAIAYATRPVS